MSKEIPKFDLKDKENKPKFATITKESLRDIKKKRKELKKQGVKIIKITNSPMGLNIEVKNVDGSKSN